MLGVREADLKNGIPSVRFTRYTCRICGEEIWVPGKQNGDDKPQCVDHFQGPLVDLLAAIVE